MRANFAVLAALAVAMAAACSSGPGGSKPRPTPPGSGGAGGEGGSAGGGGAGGERGAGGAGGRDAAPAIDAGGGPPPPPDAAVADGAAPADASSVDRGPAPADGATPTAEAGGGGGQALLVVGQIPLIGSDIQLHEQLVSRGLAVQDVLDAMATPASAAGKQVIVLSYSVDSEEVRGKFNDATVPIIVTEHNLLDSLGMTSAAGHGWQQGVTQITVTTADHPLAAGFSGDVTVYTKTGEVFWGVPSAAAIKVATVKGNPARPVTFVYPAGALMAGGKPAPGKRVQFFLGAHLTPDRWLNAAGLKMLDAAIDWCLR